MRSAPTDIIIVTFNALGKLRRCLRDLERHTPRRLYNLIIVDNHSNDGTHSFLSKHPHYHRQFLRTKKNLGFSGGANVALKSTAAPFVLLLDDDAEVTPSWLNRLYRRIRNDEKIGIIGCKIVTPDKKINCANFSLVPYGSVGPLEKDDGFRDYVTECDAVSGACWIMRRSLLDIVGYYDENFFPCQFEDIDYCLRARLAGYKVIYDGKVKIFHHNLKREGASKIVRKNMQRFFGKWRSVFRRLPLEDSCERVVLLWEGAQVLHASGYFSDKSYLGEFGSLYGPVTSQLSDLVYIGVALRERGKPSEAIRFFKSAIKRNPKNLIAQFLLSQTLFQLGRKELSHRNARKLVSVSRQFKKVIRGEA